MSVFGLLEDFARPALRVLWKASQAGQKATGLSSLKLGLILLWTAGAMNLVAMMVIPWDPPAWTVVFWPPVVIFEALCGLSITRIYSRIEAELQTGISRHMQIFRQLLYPLAVWMLPAAIWLLGLDILVTWRAWSEPDAWWRLLCCPRVVAAWSGVAVSLGPWLHPEDRVFEGFEVGQLRSASSKI